MKYFPLIWAGIWRKPVRTALILLQVALVFALFGILQGMKTGVEQSVADARADILFVGPAVFGGTPLPISYLDRLQSMPGVKTVAFADGFLGTYQRPTQAVFVLALQPGDVWLTLVPEVFKVLPRDLEALRRTRTGALISADIGRKYGWHIGDRIPLTSTTLQSGGSGTWVFDIVGTFTDHEFGEGLIRDLPGIRRNARGEPIAVFQANLFVQARSRIDGGEVGFPLAGVTSGLTDYMPELHLTSGRMFRPGLRELIASNKCVRDFAGFSAGDERTMSGGDWLVVGNFDLGRTAGVCNVFGDADTILSLFARNAYNQADVMLQSPAAFSQLTQALKADPSLRVQARREAQVTEEGMQQLDGILNFVSYFVGSIMAVAATVGAANSLYAIVDGRRREFATLRALGFGGLPIVASILSESMLLALPGAVLGALLAWLLFNGLLASPFGSSFHLAVTFSLALLGLGWALGIGLISGLLPAARAARVPVAVALSAT